MKKLIWGLTFLFITTLRLLSVSEDNYDILVVTAKGGLRMRSEANLKSKVLTVIPKNAKVKALEEKEEALIIDWKIGRWMKVQYKNKTGWVFGGFLAGPEEMEDLKSRNPIYQSLPLRFISVHSQKEALNFLNTKLNMQEIQENNLCLNELNTNRIEILPARLAPPKAPPEAAEMGHISISLNRSLLPENQVILDVIDYTIIVVQKDSKKNIYSFTVKRQDIVEMEAEEAAMIDECIPDQCNNDGPEEEYEPESYSAEDMAMEDPFTFRNEKTGQLYNFPKEMKLTLELKSDSTAFWKFKTTSSDDVGSNFFQNGYYISDDFRGMRCFGY